MQKLTPSFHYNNEDIMYDVWVTGNEKKIRTIIFLGTVQIGKIVEWVARVCPPGTAIVQGAPHWLASDDGSDVQDFVLRYSEVALEYIARKYDIADAKVIADSQAAPFILRAICDKRYVGVAGSVILLQPLGLNRQAYGRDEPSRIKTFRQRVMQNSLGQIKHLPFDGRLRYNHIQLYKLVSSDKKKANAQYAAGLEHDALDDLKKTQELGLKISIVSGARDKIFPPDEIRHSLQENKLPIPVIEVANVPHSPLPTKQGLKLLGAALSL